jgi:lipopolysaccharide/colanic/teichoic acid biosynthesis glycosyltransferase
MPLASSRRAPFRNFDRPHHAATEAFQQFIHHWLPESKSRREMARRLIDWRYRMKQHLILLPLMIVIIVIEVKFVIKVIVKKR